MADFTFPCVPQEQYEHDHDHDHHRRSFLAAEPQQAAAGCSDCHSVVVAVVGGSGGGYYYQQHRGSASRHAAEEDKMDVLWEDFNDELELAHATSPPCPLMTKGTPWTTAREASWLASAGDIDDDFVLTETRKRAVVRRKRVAILAMLRLLKKLFLAHRSGNAASRKTPPI